MSSLSHLKVLDLTSHLAGPYCAMILADHGADVVKVENPRGGDSLRMTPPFQEGESAPFMLWNRNKRSVALDLKKPGDLQKLKDMIIVADVLIENYKPGTAERLGVGYDVVSATNPKLIYCSISGFGQTGPYAPRGGFDLIASGMSGLMAINGPPEGPPYRIPVPVTDVCGGMNGAIGVLLALAAREKTGRGQHVDTSLYESGIALGVYEAANVFATGEVPERLGQAHRGSAPYQLFPTSDGYMTIGGAQDSFWRGACEILGCEHLIADSRFKTKADRVTNNKELVAEMEVYFRDRTTAALCEAFENAGIPAGPVMNHVQVYDDPQTRSREMAIEVTHPKVGPMKTIGVPVKLSGTPGGIRGPAPLLGEHTEDVIEEWTAQSTEMADD
ncbi:MAG: CoA transferase [Rhodospirillaceae bacterium]|nr:CoA transferase [Rhodospirillaceae bacterium]